jgi:2-amino-4-hydroxy-6-hydroxymethyldihydropteridine diphosphokinase
VTPVNKKALIYISLGSNILPQQNTAKAIGTIKGELTDCAVSKVYRSPAVGMEGDDFLNAVIGGYTCKSIDQVLQWLRDIEVLHGRVRTDNKFIDRPLDLDLLLYAAEVSPNLPHPDIEQQAYVLQPLADVAGTLIHPVVNSSISAMNNALKVRCPEKYEVLTPVELPG